MTALAVSAHTLTHIGQRLLVNDRGVNWLPSSPLLRQDVAESQGAADHGALVETSPSFEISAVKCLLPLS